MSSRTSLGASHSRDDAIAALAVLGSGGELLPRVNVDRFVRQQSETGGFWMSFHELTNDYPWLCKRIAHLAATSAGEGAAGAAAPPRRNFLAGLLALFVPRFGASGGLGSMIIMVAVIGILAAIAIPAYQDYKVRSEVAGALSLASSVEAAMTPYIKQEGGYPESLDDVGVDSEYADGPVQRIDLIDDGLEFTLRSQFPTVDGRTIVLSAYKDDDGGIGWECTGGTIEPKHRPLSCRAGN